MTRNETWGRLVAGLVLIALGVLFLFGQYFRSTFWEYMWPLAIIAVGGMFFIGMLAGGRQAGGLAIPGSIITMIGLIFLYMTTFGNWEAWSYAWALIPTAVGIGMTINGLWSGEQKLRRDGINTMGVGLVLFVAFGTFFEVVVGFHTGIGTVLWPVGLIAVGAYLTVRALFANMRPAPVMMDVSPSTPVLPVTPTEPAQAGSGMAAPATTPLPESTAQAIANIPLERSDGQREVAGKTN